MLFSVVLVVIALVLYSWAIWGFWRKEKTRHSVMFLIALALDWIATGKMMIMRTEGQVTAHGCIAIFALLGMTVLGATVLLRLTGTPDFRVRHSIWKRYLFWPYALWVFSFFLGVFARR